MNFIKRKHKRQKDTKGKILSHDQPRTVEALKEKLKAENTERIRTLGIYPEDDIEIR